MTSFRRRLADRTCDLFDWVDFRPDPDCRWCWAVPVLFVAAFVLSTSIGLLLAFAIAFAATAAVLVLALVIMTAWVVGNALADVVWEAIEALPRAVPKQRPVAVIDRLSRG